MSYEAWGEPDGRPYPGPAVLPACMGGNCNLRNTCARYHQPVRRDDPAERLCTPNRNELWVKIEPSHGKAFPTFEGWCATNWNGAPSPNAHDAYERARAAA